MIFHVDVNSAFLSWESVYRMRELGEETDLRLIPSAVGGDQEARHGVILAKSTPAKQFNIQTGEPIVNALRKCPNLTIVPVRFDIYRKYSNAFLEILRSYTSVIEKFSIDEAFMDMSNYPGIQEHPVEIATKLKDQIYSELGFTVNVGISTNKLLAKMAGDFKKPNLVHTLFPDEIPKKMWPLNVRDLLFVGKATEQKLNNLGIRTIGELAHADYKTILSHFGKHGTMIYEYANGIDHSVVTATRPEPKGYSNSTTIAHDVTDVEEAKRILLSLCETVGARLREDDVLACVVAVSITDCNFHNSSHQLSLTSATNSTTELYRNVCALFLRLWDHKTPIRLLGVHTSKLTKEDNHQYTLFELQQKNGISLCQSKEDRHQTKSLSSRNSFEKVDQARKLDHALDEIRKKFGDTSIVRASLLTKDTKDPKKSK